ncbi:hypothetical protein [Treponema phagedenis]|nr:hypothetical protein [Treponema phagedenis]
MAKKNKIPSFDEALQNSTGFAEILKQWDMHTEISAQKKTNRFN